MRLILCRVINPALSACNHKLEAKKIVFFSHLDLVIADYQHLLKTILHCETRKNSNALDTT